MSKKFDDFSVRMKKYEHANTLVVDTNLPICIRVDGKRFSKFTSGMDRPFDEDMLYVMQQTAKNLFEEFRPSCVYVQSDEISLVWLSNQTKSAPFDGKIQKLASVSAAKATSFFIKNLLETKYSTFLNKIPSFDSRVWNVPDDVEALNVILWRVQDAMKNSVQSIFRYKYGHAACNKMSQKDMKAKLVSDNFIIEEKYPLTTLGGSLYYKDAITETSEDIENSWVRRRIKCISGVEYRHMNMPDRFNLISKNSELI